MTWLRPLLNILSIGSKSYRLRLTFKIFILMMVLVTSVQVLHSQMAQWPGARNQAPLINLYDKIVQMAGVNHSLGSVAQVDRTVAHVDGSVRHMAANAEEQLVSNTESKSPSVHTEPEGSDLVFLPVVNHDAWIYSAHYDTQPDIVSMALVRVFGIATYTRDPVFCHFLNDEHKVISGPGQRRFIRDAHNKKYVAAFFDCPIGRLVSPKYISVTYNKSDDPIHWILIHYPKPLTRNFTVCYAALFDYNRTSQLIQSIEINLVLGAQHFYVYNYSISAATDAVLRHYQNLGLLTVLQWQLPTLEIWYYAQNMAINDCVYRNRLVSQFVVIQDTDEFIIPKKHDSWAELLHAVQSDFYERPSISTDVPLASFAFETSYFYGTPSTEIWQELMGNYSIMAEEEKFLTDNAVIPFLHVQRKTEIYTFSARTKTIVRPEHVFNSGIHFTHSHRGSATYTVVSNDLAIVHHFKKNGVHTVLDPAILRFKASVVPALEATFKTLSHLL